MKKQITIMGNVWDFWPILKMFDRLYESRFISFYKPWLKGEIERSKILLFREKVKSPLVWPFKLVIRTFKIIRTIKSFKPNLVITHHDEANISILPVIFLNKIFRFSKQTKFFLWIRNNPIERYKNGLYARFMLFTYKYLYPLADYIIVQTKMGKKIIERNFPLLRNKVIVFPNVYDIKRNIELSKEKIEKKYKKIFSSGFVFINIGRLDEQKGQWFLIRAFKKVVESYPDAKLVIIGKGALKNKLYDLSVRLNINDKVFLLGMQPNPFKFLVRSHCLVFPSLFEGMPNVVIEALSLNIPVISTDCKTGPREILCPDLEVNEKIQYPYYGEYGILTKPFPRKFIWDDLKERPLIEEEKMLANLMIEMIKDKNLRRRYSNGIKRAKDFDIEKIIKEWEKLMIKLK